MGKAYVELGASKFFKRNKRNIWSAYFADKSDLVNWPLWSLVGCPRSGPTFNSYFSNICFTRKMIYMWVVSQ